MQQAVAELLERYARETNRCLAGEADPEALGQLYTESFIGASPSGVLAGEKNDEFLKALVDGFARYRAIGTQKMVVLNLRVEPIDEIHALARVDWRATYGAEGSRKEIDFTNAYLVRVDDNRARVFGWITGDEEAVLREHGIID